MKTETPLPELIDVWLSGQKSPGSRRALGTALARGPEAAAELAAQARTEASLRMKLGPHFLPVTGGEVTPTATRTHPGKKWLLAAGLAAAALLTLLAWPSGDTGTVSRKARPRSVTRIPARTVILSKQEAPPPLTAGDAALQRLLDRYWLSGNSFHPGIPLSGATSRLVTEIRAANLLKRPELDSLAIEVRKLPEMEKEPLVTFTSGVTAGGLLRVMAAQAKADLVYKDGQVILSVRPPGPAADRHLVTVIHPVPPDFIGNLKGITGDEDLPLSIGDPDLQAKDPAPGLQARMREDFTALAGLETPGGSSMKFDARAGTLTLESTQEDQTLTGTTLDNLLTTATSPLISLECKLIEGGENLSLKEQVLSETDTQLLMKDLNARQDLSVLSYPSILVMNQRAASIRSLVSQEVPPAGADSGELDFTGIEIDVIPAFTGEAVGLSATVNVGRREEDSGVIVHDIVELTAALHPGQGAILQLPSRVPGRRSFGILSARGTTPDGELPDK